VDRRYSRFEAADCPFGYNIEIGDLPVDGGSYRIDFEGGLNYP